MTIIYKKLFPDWEWSFDDYEVGRNVLYLDPCAERYEESLGDRLLSLDKALRDSDCIIFRGRTRKFISNVSRSRCDLRAQLRTKPVFALVGSARKSPAASVDPYLIQISGRELSLSTSIEVFRRIELNSILSRSSAIFAPADHHYSLPSGQHVRQFVRLACALQDPVEISRIVDWLLPLIDKRTILIGDTGTILPLLYSVRIEATQVLKANVSIRVLDRYPKAVTAVAKVVKEARAKLGVQGGKLLFIVSVNSSGQFVRYIEQLAPSDKLFRSAVALIVDTSGALSPHTVLFDYPITRYAPSGGRCEVCKKGLPSFPIDGRTYERLPKPIWKRVHIKKADASKHTAFWRAVEDTGALEFNRDYQHGRHYSMYIDLAQLMRSSWFGPRAEQQLRAMGRPQLVVVPDHEATELLVAVAQKTFNHVPVEIVSGESANRRAKQKIARLRENDSILIFDDAYVEGGTLPKINNLIYSLNKGVRRQAFVLLARPSNTEQFKRSAQRFVYESRQDNRHFGSGYFILLPRHDDCPWVTERKILAEIIESRRIPAREREVLQRRVSVLEGRKMWPPILWEENYDGGKRVGGSYFGKLTEATLYAAAAAASHARREQMQSIRLGNPIGSERADLEGGAIEPYFDLIKIFRNYFDRSIISAVLRTLTVEELSRYGFGDKLNEPLSKLISGNEYGSGIIEEILWATYLRKIPRESVLPLVKARTRRSDIADVLILLIENQWEPQAQNGTHDTQSAASAVV